MSVERERINHELAVDGLVCRYAATDDGLPEGESKLGAMQLLARRQAGVDRPGCGGRELFESLLRLANDVGLLSEENRSSVGRPARQFSAGPSERTSQR